MIRLASWLAVFWRRIEVKFAWWFRRETPGAGPMGLKKKLIAERRTRWLDVGNGDRFEEGFEYLDWLVRTDIDTAIRNRCHQADILNLAEGDFANLGKFDLIRMQHVLEHFSLEEGPRVLANCERLLNPGGVLLITVPDLDLFARAYLGHAFGLLKSFRGFATGRIPPDAPGSYYFSVFAHSFGYSPEIEIAGSRAHRDQHKWCYDFMGLDHLLRASAAFGDVRRIGLLHPLACIPFTHNRPEQDLCVMARAKGA